jgi:DNA polymerase-3 subunit epsilon
MQETFTAIDFETAHPQRWSICQVGLVRVENGEVVRERSLLIQPPDNYYWRRFTDIHGIDWTHTRNAPDFASVWPVLQPWIHDQLLVAHNAAFDMGCLRQVLDYYGLDHPPFQSACTYRLYRRGLATICAERNIPLNHHDALSDARACAQLYLSADNFLR